jgi:hypothetical protein
MAQLPNKNNNAKKLKEFSQVSRDNNYKDQACFFLNAYWAEHEKQADQCWTYVNKFNELDLKKHGDGVSLDEFESARFLEAFGQAMTVIERRNALKEIDIDTDNKMSFLEYITWKLKLDIDTLMTRPQGTNEELKKASQALKDVQDEIKRIENEKEKLEAASQGEGVKAKKAKAELEMLLKADQMPLRKALITAEAAVRKAQKSSNMAAQGTLWWLNKELEEAKKYKPKGGVKPIAKADDK